MHFESRISVIESLGWRSAGLARLKDYVDLLWTSNQELNLISRQMSYEELIDNHVIDCLLPLRFFPPNPRAVADLGSGGGLPGVLYALHFPETCFHLFEKSPRKREFLQRCERLAPNLKIHAEISDLKAIDLVTARAFKPIDVILDMTRAYLQSGRPYFLLKGRAEKIEEELRLARKKFKGLNVTLRSLASPVLDVERHLVQLHV